MPRRAQIYVTKSVPLLKFRTIFVAKSLFRDLIAPQFTQNLSQKGHHEKTINHQPQ